MALTQSQCHFLWAPVHFLSSALLGQTDPLSLTGGGSGAAEVTCLCRSGSAKLAVVLACSCALFCEQFYAGSGTYRSVQKNQKKSFMHA